MEVKDINQTGNVLILLFAPRLNLESVVLLPHAYAIIALR